MAEAVAVILGSAFAGAGPRGLDLEPQDVSTPFGEVRLFAVRRARRLAYVLFRHGRPHRFLPHQIPYRAHARALREAGCAALLVTSSVGVLDPSLPLFRPLLVSDLLMPDNRLPDGSACTMFPEPESDQGHLVLDEGLFSSDLGRQVRDLAAGAGTPVAAEAVFAYVGGPRTKTLSENRFWARAGAQVNSMSLGPEVVLANELGIPTAGLVFGHKYSVPEVEAPDDLPGSLAASREAMERIVVAFVERGAPAPFRNRIHRFGRDAR